MPENKVITFQLAGTQTYQDTALMCMRQDKLGTKYTTEHGTLFLVPEPKNPYDPLAVRVDVDTKDVYTVGYIPRSVCLACGKNNTGASADHEQCRFCKVTGKKMAFNKYVKEKIEAGRIMKAGILSVASAVANGTLGVTFAIRFLVHDLPDDPLHLLTAS